jgi:hypothetical protein
MSTGLVHHDAYTASPSSIGDMAPQSFGDRLDVIESELKATKSRIVHHEKTINLDALVAKFDAKFTKIDARFDAMEAKFDRKFEQMETKFDKKFEQMETSSTKSSNRWKCCSKRRQ